MEDTRGWHFVDVTSRAGFEPSVDLPPVYPEWSRITGGVGVSDYDQDGDVDMFLTQPPPGGGVLLRNRGNGVFDEATIPPLDPETRTTGVLFADVSGDGRDDILIGGIGESPVQLLLQRPDRSFEWTSAERHFPGVTTTFSASLADYDGDGDLDAALTHWGVVAVDTLPGHLWRNDGTGRFLDVSVEAGLEGIRDEVDFTFTANFTDLDDDGWPDLLIAADFGESRVMLNRGDGTFDDWTAHTITDENGMGAAVADFDNDGDMDWFVSSIAAEARTPEGNWGITGNRLYQNLGDGRFDDGTDVAGVRDGGWGWGACAQDLNNDGNLDIFHVNGWGTAGHPGVESFMNDHARLFVGRDGVFDERAVEVGLEHTAQGRGVSCFDFDGDGDIDIAVVDLDGAVSLFRNEAPEGNRFLTVRLVGPTTNHAGIGARVFAESPNRKQVREIRAGNNFLSHDAAVAHFGLGASDADVRVHVRWPCGAQSTVDGVAVNRALTVVHP